MSKLFFLLLLHSFVQSNNGLTQETCSNMLKGLHWISIPALPFWNIEFSLKNPFSLFHSSAIGDQIRRKRQSLELLQKDVAKLIKVSIDCITYWENKRALPQIHHFPAIITFLGFNPFKKVCETLSIQIQNYRIEHGLSHKRISKSLGVDASTVASWEKGKFKPNRKIRGKLLRLLSKS